MAQTTPWFVYFLRCYDQSIYIGITTNVVDRLQEHQRGQGTTYTSRRLPVLLLGYEAFISKQQAAARERSLKGLTRAKKEAVAGSLRPPPEASG